MRALLLPAGLVALGLILVGCSSGDSPSATPASSADTSPAAESETATPTATAAADAEARLIARLSRGFDTDFTIRSIDLSELLSGGPGKDGIPAIDAPTFISFGEAAEWLDDQEPVVALEVNGDARAYPLQILIWHEIANDTVGGVPVLVTFCPLCNTAISFERTIDGDVRTFGVSGLLRNSDLVMYDRTNESLWQQISGDAIVGVDVGSRLDFIPSFIVSFAEFRATYPEGSVLSRDTGHSRSYGSNPYAGYDRIDSSPIFPVEGGDARLAPKERVLTFEVGGEPVAVPFTLLEEQVVVSVAAGDDEVVALWQPGTVSALDGSSIAGSRDVGAAAAYRPVLDGTRLEFEARDGLIVDQQTGSTWNVLGRAVAGELEGATLEPVISANHFWFSWVVFQPATRVIE